MALKSFCAYISKRLKLCEVFLLSFVRQIVSFSSYREHLALNFKHYIIVKYYIMKKICSKVYHRVYCLNEI